MKRQGATQASAPQKKKRAPKKAPTRKKAAAGKAPASSARAAKTAPSAPTSAPRKPRPDNSTRSRQPARSEQQDNAAPTAPQDASHLLPSARYLFFGGKGGVGKTTAAAAAALYLLAQARTGERILLFSTDPAHSLSDSLETEIGDRLVEVAARRGAHLYAREMDASAALADFKTQHRAVIQEIADRGTLLDESDINELLDLSLPGMDEVMALFELSEIDRAGSYARIVVDTAPSGHTSRLLRLPEVFARWTKALDLMTEKHRFMVARFARGARRGPDKVELFLQDLAERIARVRAMLYDPAQASFTLVAIPEAMAVAETARYLTLLRENGVPVTDLIINRVEQAHDDCHYCRARARAQQPYLAQLAAAFKQLRLHHAPLMPGEARGPAALRRFARAVWTEQSVKPAPRSRQTAAAKRKHIGAQQRGGATLARLGSRRLLLFGGKGGVGKTTAAAATALALAAGDKQRRILIFSTDPAHSLSDSFAEQIGESQRGVGGQANLDAMEIDPAARFAELKERYRRWTDELFESLTGGSRWEIQFDREAMRELIALAPPGVDEIAALSVVSDLLEEERYTTIVLDTAPTGHLIRFLELPELALAWVRAFIRLLLKYKNIIRWSGVAAELVALSQSIKRVAALLTDATACEFVGVAIPERMSMAETVRLSDTLARLGIPLRRLLINNVVPAEAAAGCAFCAARRRAQGRVIKDFRLRLKRGREIYLAPQQPQEIRGAHALREHFASWQRISV